MKAPRLLVLAGAFLPALTPLASATDNFSPTGSMTGARTAHIATLLSNGKVLVAGGYNGSNYLASAELYDPASGTWSTTGSMTTARTAAADVLLPNGKVLVVGGRNAVQSLASAELYDPTSGTWSATGSMATAREFPTATLLSNGKVLVVGGDNDSDGYLASAELYDPASGTWSTTGSMATTRLYHTATRLPNGKVLVAGGYYVVSFPNIIHLASAEIYNPASGTWSTTGSMTAARYEHTATLLPNGKVLVAGGSSTSAELYDPASGTWSATGALATSRWNAVAALLPNGKVLVAGGSDIGGNALASAELYFPAWGTWVGPITMTTAREAPSSTLLSNGKLLVAGGHAGGSWLSSAELFLPSPGSKPPPPPTFTIRGEKLRVTTRESLVFRGTVDGEVTAVTWRLGKKSPKTAKLSGSSWKFKVRLPLGKSKIKIIVTGPGGSSAPTKAVVVRKK